MERLIDRKDKWISGWLEGKTKYVYNKRLIDKWIEVKIELLKIER